MKTLITLRKRLALPKTSWQLCLLATIGGALSALLIVLFTLSIDAVQQLYMSKRDDYSSLDSLSRFLLPIIGACVILIFSWLTGYKYLRTGIPLVLHRLKVAHGVIPFRNTLNQFFGSVIALGTGFSVGREGPAVHLGAACSSFIGRFMSLPHNSTRTLCACGIAAGISASFNTPIAAVIFVMEVILREYKIHIFIPVMMASIVGSMITSSVFGPAHEFEFMSKIALTHGDYPYLVLLGLILGVISFLFNRLLIKIIRLSSQYHIVPRLMLAAIITAILGYAAPYAMGTDIGAIGFVIDESPAAQLLVGLLVAKIMMTVFALGLGIPGGIVGPILGIGAIAGSCLAVAISQFYPDSQLTSDFALMGMAGFMAATLNAPLAALLAVVEMSNQLEAVVPAMVVIATASVASGQFFNNRSIFVMQLEVQKLVYREPPLEKSLQRVGVLGVMNENITLLSHANAAQTKTAIEGAAENEFVVIKNHENKQAPYAWLTLTNEQNGVSAEVITHSLIPISNQATLAEAYLALNQARKGGVYVEDASSKEIIGIVTFDQIRSFLLTGKLK